jgi:hypothetical protein
MILCGIDEQEITGDVLDRRVPRPGNWGRHLPNARWEGAQPKMIIPLREPCRGTSIEPV